MMKTKIGFGAAVFVLLAGAAIAEWNATKQDRYVERLSNLAHQMQDSREECLRVEAIWNDESVSTDPDFVDHPSGITEAQQTAMITYCQAFTAFNENGVVATSNRSVNLTPFLSAGL